MTKEQTAFVTLKPEYDKIVKAERVKRLTIEEEKKKEKLMAEMWRIMLPSAMTLVEYAKAIKDNKPGLGMEPVLQEPREVIFRWLKDEFFLHLDFYDPKKYDPVLYYDAFFKNAIFVHVKDVYRQDAIRKLKKSTYLE